MKRKETEVGIKERVREEKEKVERSKKSQRIGRRGNELSSFTLCKGSQEPL